ncbi:MAG: ArnT family glycosyltransferase [Promethearchaeota archaeon]
MGENLVIHFCKKNWNWILLAFILIFAFYLRAYHIDYPVVGYHNWKETHYLTEARNFARDGFFEHGFFIPACDYPSLKDDPSGAHSDTFPTSSIIVALFFMIFGLKLWLARLIHILFALGSIFFSYLLVKKLFNREDLALTLAVVLAINPLLVFFGRQVQLINPALFFCLMGSYFYFKWIEDFSWKNTILFSVPLFLGILTKYSFALFLISLFFIFPFKKLLDKKKWPKYIFIILNIILCGAWFFYTKSISSNVETHISRNIKLGTIFTSQFWSIMYSFVKDNYTILGILFAIFGLLIFLKFYKKNKKYIGYRYILFYLLGSVIWFIILAKKMQGHNYHQYPLLFLIAFFIAYAFIFIAVNASKIINVKYLKYFILIGLIILLFIPTIKSKNRMFDTQFYGLDIAGDYIKDNKLPDERVIHSGHQAYGLLWHGDLKGTRAIPKTIEDIEYAEEKLNASWLFIYNWDFNIMQDEERWDYISNNYALKQIGFIQTNQGMQPIYFLLKRDGTFNINELNDMLKDKIPKKRIYELTRGEVVMNYVNFD